jgi:hypothetical protein
MSRPFDPKRPAQTRSGIPVRVLCTDRHSSHPIVTLIRFGGEDQPERLAEYTSNGRRVIGWNDERDDDLVNVPHKRARFIGVYDRDPGLGQPAVVNGIVSPSPMVGVRNIRLEYVDGVLTSASLEGQP